MTWPNLPTFDCPLSDDGLEHSRRKLHEAAFALTSTIDFSSSSVVRLPCLTRDETLGYRCSCSFQLLSNPFRWAMRNNFAPVALNTDRFPIALGRIQEAMAQFVLILNDTNHDVEISTHLTGATFSSSWDESDLNMTLHYGGPKVFSSINGGTWTSSMKVILNDLKITSIIGRSKGVRTVVGRESTILTDVVTVTHPIHKSPISVKYEKPEGAFMHPNHSTMLKALNWMLTTISSLSSSSKTKMNLLEMYCGFGAHTVVLSKASVFDRVVAIEMDKRLVEYAEKNILLNDMQGRAFVFKDDAKNVARQGVAKYFAKKFENPIDFDVLLVDPPRSGLDKSVCSLGEWSGAKRSEAKRSERAEQSTKLTHPSIARSRLASR